MNFPYIQIKFSDDIDFNNKKFIKEYWLIKNGDFPNKPTQVKIQYKISEQVKNDILTLASYEIVTGECCDCKTSIKFRVRNQTEAKPKIINPYYHFFCDTCKEVLKHESRHLNKKDRKSSYLYNSFKHQIWTKLNNQELALLKTILRLSKWELIFRELLQPDFYRVWPSIRKLSDIHLIDIYVNPLTGLTREIYFLPELAYALKIETANTSNLLPLDNKRASKTMDIEQLLYKKYLR